MRDYDRIPLKNLIRACDKRRNMTNAERLLWYRLRNNQLGTKFRRQHAIDSYIVDFVSLEHSIIIEVDGATHSSDEERARDIVRTKRLNALGYRVLRFTNRALYSSLEGVVETIARELTNA